MAKNNEMCAFCGKVKTPEDTFIGKEEGPIACSVCLRILKKTLQYHNSQGSKLKIIRPKYFNSVPKDSS